MQLGFNVASVTIEECTEETGHMLAWHYEGRLSRGGNV